MKSRFSLAVSILVLLTVSLAWAPKRIYVGSLPLPSQLGIEVPGDEVELGTWADAKITDAAKVGNLDKLAVIATDPGSVADMASLGVSKGDAVKIKFSSQFKCEIAFPKQQVKAKVHFVEERGKFRAIVDWLGSLEAQE